MYICLCKGLTESDVRQAGEAGHIEPAQLITRFGWDDSECCGRCADQIDEMATLAAEPLPCFATCPARLVR
jgi:bacterioferritin-associated ferredoxin